MTHACLDDQTIADFVAGVLPAVRRAEVEESIDVCEACRSLVALVVASAPPADLAALAADFGSIGAPAALADATVPVETPLGGRFRLERAAGRGAMGTVFRARDSAPGEAVAVKLMYGDFPERARVAREVRLLAEVRHPAIVRYVDHGADDEGRLWLVMEWLEGIDLGDRLHAGRLTVDETLAVGLQVASGLEELHRRGIVHRDIKPGNLVLVAGRVEELRIVDLGIAHEQAPRGGRLTMTGAILGTPGYMAPEQARGETAVGAAADVFALGAVLYQALTGQSPFRGDDVVHTLMNTVLHTPPRPSAHRADVPAELDALIMAMLAKAPGDRPASAQRVGEALRLSRQRLDAGQPPSRSLTNAERRFTSVVLVRPPAGAALRYDAELAGLAARHGGKLEAMLDGSLVVSHRGSGVPTDLAAQAARCALLLRARLGGAAVALVTGRGQLDTRDDAAVLGRLAQLPPSRGAVTVDSVTAGLLDARFELAPHGDWFELRAEHEPGDRERTLLGRPSPCVGRQRELAALEALALECFAEPIARKVLVVGEPGIGKSRVRRELLRRLQAAAWSGEIWLGRGPGLGAGSPFSLLAPALLRSAGIAPADPPAVRRQKLAARATRHAEVASSDSERERLVAFLGESVGVPSETGQRLELEAARADATLMADQIHQAWSDFLRAECAAHPMLVVLEDVHWGDRPSVQVLAAAVGTLGAAPFLVLAFARPEALERFPELGARQGAEEIHLRPLGRRASEELVHAVLGNDIGSSTLDRIVGLAQGNAYFLEACIRAVAEGRGDAPPETILAMTEALLARLDAEPRRVLRAASVLGGAFWPGAVSALLGRSVTITAVDGALSELGAAEMISRSRDTSVPGEVEHRFRHALLREAAYATLTDDDRRQGHARAARWLGEHRPDDHRALAEHFSLGGQPGDAALHFVRAAARALAADDIATAAELCGRALSCAEEDGAVPGPLAGEMHGVQASVHRLRGQLADAARSARRALELLPRGGPAWFAAAAIAVHTAGRLDDDEAFAQAEAEMVTTAPLPGAAEERVKALHAVLAQLWFKGRVDAWAALVTRVEVETDFGSPALAARLHHEHARAAMRAGDLGAYIELLREGATQALRVGDVRYAFNLRFALAHGLMEIGLPEEVEPLFRELERHPVATLDFFVTGVHINVGRALAALDDLPRAREVLAEAVARCQAQGDRRSEGGVRTYLADALRRLGLLADAEREARRALSVLGAASPLAPRARAALARALMAAGQAEAAQIEAAEALRALEAGGWVEEGATLVMLTFAEAAAVSGDTAAARHALLEARTRLLERAARIRDPRYREMFLGRVAENARTLALAATWEAPNTTG